MYQSRFWFYFICALTDNCHNVIYSNNFRTKVLLVNHAMENKFFFIFSFSHIVDIPDILWYSRCFFHCSKYVVPGCRLNFSKRQKLNLKFLSIPLKECIIEYCQLSLCFYWPQVKTRENLLFFNLMTWVM